MDFKAAMFDFDGTVTPDGVYYPTEEMIGALADLTQKIPIAFCTGRQLESFEKHAMKFFKDKVNYSNFFLIAENGSIGYDYNLENDKFEEFYRTSWPSELADRDELMTHLHEAVKEYGEVCYDAHRVVVVMRTHITNIDQGVRDIKKVNEYSTEIYKIVLKALYEINPDYENFVHVGDSGIGVVIVPTDGDKDNGIYQFGLYLKENRGLSFDDSFREIMAVGDRPDIEGNDHYFLKGRIGSPFTVGHEVEGSEFPKPVLNKNGKRLLHDKGTLHLIKGIVNS